MRHPRRIGGFHALPHVPDQQTRARRLVGGLAAVTMLLSGMLMASAGPAGAAPKAKTACNDRIDNDGDGFVDHKRRGGDPDCASRDDDSEEAVFMCTDEEGDDGLYETPPPVPNAFAQCNLFTGEVEIRACHVNFWNLNGVVEDGCEYGPVPYTGDEVCDNVDNDADGSIDEGLVAPTVANGFATCRDGAWVLFCNPGFLDSNGVFDDGCETPEPV